MLRKRIFCLAGALLLLCGCSASPRPGTAENEILTMAEIPAGKLPITVSQDENTKSGNLETVLEQQFPGVDIIMISSVTANSSSRCTPRLEHHDLPDVILTNRPDYGKNLQPDALMDLSGLDVSGDYYVSTLRPTLDGHLYFLPGPSEICGIVYNKTLFAEHGWQLPHDFDSFVALCQTIENSGYRALEAALSDPRELRALLGGFSFQSVFNGPENAEWLARYKAGEGSMVGHMEPFFQVYQTFLNTGIIRPSDFARSNQQRNEDMFRDRKCAMIMDSSKCLEDAARYDCRDAFGFLPFYGIGEDADFVLTQPLYDFSVSKNLQNTGNERKLEQVLQILNYLSSAEGQRMMMGEEPAMIGSIRGMEPENTAFLQTVYPTLEKGNMTRRDTLLDFIPFVKNNPLYDGLRHMANGTGSPLEVMLECDARRLDPQPETHTQIAGFAAADFTMLETGCYMADVVRQAADADIAVHLAASPNLGVNRKFYAGPVSQELLTTMVPIQEAPADGAALQVANITGATLRALLEDPPEPIDLNTGIPTGYYTISGIRMEFAPWAPPGSRVLKLQHPDGSPLDESHTYRVAFCYGAVKPAYCPGAEFTGPHTFLELLQQAVSGSGTITPPSDGRMKLNWQVTGGAMNQTLEKAASSLIKKP